MAGTALRSGPAHRESNGKCFTPVHCPLMHLDTNFNCIDIEFLHNLQN